MPAFRDRGTSGGGPVGTGEARGETHTDGRADGGNDILRSGVDKGGGGKSCEKCAGSHRDGRRHPDLSGEDTGSDSSDRAGRRMRHPGGGGLPYFQAVLPRQRVRRPAGSRPGALSGEIHRGGTGGNAVRGKQPRGGERLPDDLSYRTVRQDSRICKTQRLC